MILKLKQYIYIYDPSHASFYYALKAIVALIISVALAYFLNLDYHILFALLSCMFIFYMNVFDSVGLKKAAYLSLLIINSCIFIYFIDFFNKIGLWLVVPTFIWVFWVSFTQQIRLDLFRVNVYSTILCLSALVFSQNNTIDIHKAMLGVIVGGVVAILFRCVSFHTYGAYTKKSFLMLLNDLEHMAKYLNDKEFDNFNAIFISHVNEIKTVFSSKSVKIKDQSFIKHHKLAIFYLYKCEEIGALFVSMYGFFKKNKSNSHILSIQDEICYNINELKKIFKNQTPHLCKRRYEIVKNLGKLPILCELMEVVFFKFELFANGGELVLEDKQTKFTNSSFITTFKQAFANQENIKLSIKTALAAALGVFVALFFKLDHGIWVAIGVFSLLKSKKNSTKIAIIQTVLGAFAGFVVGFLLILLFKDTFLFLLVVILSYFACMYFKHFPYTLSVASIMANLALFFAVIGADYERLIVFRMIDIGISLIIVILVSWFVWPSKSEDDIIPNVLKIIDKQSKLFNDDFIQNQNEISLLLHNFSNLISECQNKKNYFKYHKILQTLKELNSALVSFYSYLDSINMAKNYKVLSDIRLLNTRFDMIKNMTNSLPYYFYDEVRSKLSSTNPKMAYFLLLVAKKQDELYKNIKVLL